MRRRLGRTTAAIVLAGVTGVGLVAAQHAEARKARWEHGGDDVVVHAVVGTTEGTAAPHGAQTFGVEVAWDGTPAGGDKYAFVLLDRRFSPPGPIDGMEVRSGGEAEGAHWDARYDVLAMHYPWLARTASVEGPGYWTNDSSALGVRAAPQGQAALTFWSRRGDLPVTDPSSDLLLAMVFVGADGEVQWAKEVPLQRAP